MPAALCQARCRSASTLSGWLAADGSARTTNCLACSPAETAGDADEASSSAKSWRHMCRSLRFTLLRVTALPTALDTTKPTCVFTGGRVSAAACVEAGFASRACTTTVDPPARTPRRIVDAKSADERSRAWAANTLGRQNLATLAAACVDYCTTRAGTHPRAKTMLARTATIARLIGALAHVYLR